MFEKNKSIQNILILILGLLTLAYVFFRAKLVPLTFDEISTIHNINSNDLYNFNGANNHFLNTLLAKLSINFFGESELTYRLPNVLAFILYFLFSYKITQLISQRNQLMVLLMIVLMPFMIDFFSLSRGYGLSIGFMLPSLYYLIKYNHNEKIYALILSLVFGVLTILSNFGFINYFIPLIASLYFLNIFKFNITKKNFVNLAIISIITVICLWFLMPILLELKEGGHLYFGGNTGFIEDTIFSLGRCFSYFNLNPKIGEVFFLILFIISLIKSLFSIYSSLFVTRKRENIGIYILYLLAVISPILQSLIFDTHFPSERTALMYFPLMIITIFTENGFLNKILNKSRYLIGFVFLIHFVFSINFTHCYSWRYDSGSKNAIKTIFEISGGKKTSVGINYIYNPSMNYYKGQKKFNSLILNVVTECWEYKLGLEELNPYYFGAQERKTSMNNEDVQKLLSLDCDFYYFDKTIINELKKNSVKFEIIAQYESSRSYLIKIL